MMLDLTELSQEEIELFETEWSGVIYANKVWSNVVGVGYKKRTKLEKIKRSIYRILRKIGLK